jgi:hypothetical protein
MNTWLKIFFMALALLQLPMAAGEPMPAGPAAKFQGDFFGEMARAFALVVSVDTKAQTVTAKLDRADGKVVTILIRPDSELHFRDSWGELSDYFPGQRVMLFMYVDDEKNWTYPRAIQDDIHVSARHGWFAIVTAIDKTALTYATKREEKEGQGKVTKVIENTYSYDPAVKIWKGDTPGGIDTLQIGDEVIQQLIEKDGKKVAVEILDKNGDDAVRAVQDAKHKKDEDALGLMSYINDFNVLTGALTVSVAWCNAARAKQLKVGETIVIQPADGSKAFASMVSSIKTVDSRTRLELIVNSRVASRLNYGQVLRVFMPGSGPEIPTGKLGVPDLSKLK